MAEAASAIQFLAIDTIREDVIVLKEGGLRVVLMCSSLNFALKSTDEQDAITFQYENFLNSLDFSVQFVIHSRKLNIAPYIDSLRARQKNEDNELLKIQINEYIDFITSFVEMTNIMSKTFYVVVPFTPSILEQKGFASRITGMFTTKKTTPDAGPFEEQKNQLWQRVNAVISGLRRISVRSVALNTDELIELFYGLYNPSEFEITANAPSLQQVTE